MTVAVSQLSGLAVSQILYTRLWGPTCASPFVQTVPLPASSITPALVADTNDSVTFAGTAGAPPSVSLPSTFATAGLAARAGNGDVDASSTASIVSGVGAADGLGVIAMPLGLAVLGASGVTPSWKVSLTRLSAVSILAIVLKPGIVTYTLAPSGVIATPDGVCCWFQRMPSAPRSVQPNKGFAAVPIAAVSTAATVRPGKKAAP